MRHSALRLVASLAVFLLTIGPSHAAVPRLVRYQGKAVDSKKVPLEGPYNLTFRLYDAATAGTIVWQEPQTNVPLSGGHFSVLLGQVNPLTVDWSKPLWLSVQVNTDPELAPRQQITSVPLALRAEVAEGLVTQITTSTITDDANKLVPTGAVILWIGSACPAGYTRLSALDDRFLVGGGSYNAAAGGSNAHTHGAGSFSNAAHTHTLAVNSGAAQGNSVDNQIAVSGGAIVHTSNGGVGDQPRTTTTSGGTGTITGTSASQDSRPAFATVLLCKKD